MVYDRNLEPKALNAGSHAASRTWIARRTGIRVLGRVQGLGLIVQGLGFRVWGSRLGVQGSRLRV